MSSMFSDISQSEKTETIERYLNELIPEWNLRLFCDVRMEPGVFPRRMLWVEKITILHEEEAASAYAHEEKYCLEGNTLKDRFMKDRKKSVLSEQIKYMLEKIKDYFKKIGKKKGR